MLAGWRVTHIFLARVKASWRVSMLHLTLPLNQGACRGLRQLQLLHPLQYCPLQLAPGSLCSCWLRL